MSRLEEILDELATTIHNLGPGDVGSMDRVLVPIAEAKAAITKLILEDVIGEDEQTEFPDSYGNIGISPEAEARNRLRASQRGAVAKLEDER